MKITKQVFGSTLLAVTGLLSSGINAAAMPELKGNEVLWLLNQANQLIKVNPSAPDKVIEQKTLTGLAKGEMLQGIDYRVAYGVLFALSDKGQLYTINTGTGALTAVGAPLPAGTLQQGQFGFDFNPAADRIRVVNDKGQNLRLHPVTAELASTDPTLQYAPDDSHHGKTPAVTAAAYTYNQQDSKITTNYAIDITAGNLLTQGTKEGTTPAVSPNTGQLFTVGSLGLTALQQVSFDISDLSNIGLVAASTAAEPASTLYQIDLSSGKTQKLGTLADGSALAGIAIEP
ncbi:DUF4394 domain-containing protein [Rheinheimera sp. EpRS3]|uniref:DUF4394 domain-containing protein n=1 Tax=Rheinheimera sp. EpRS3 TaxID=1712383 RepID=UPI00074913F5|nr:DUF4394 domain-containing protein [Rheinheimera sp. EpRS3]KUM53461.1 hypothetical protein AR688_06010 [Rheinheimera sp. EpRS3]